VAQVVQQPFIFALNRSAEVLRSPGNGTAVVLSRAWGGVLAPWRRDPDARRAAPAPTEPSATPAPAETGPVTPATLARRARVRK
jgi:hypothetical protein